MVGTGLRVCPECGKEYAGHPALSRKDNETFICPDCGVRQSLMSMGVDPVEIEKIVLIIREHVGEGMEKCTQKM